LSLLPFLLRLIPAAPAPDDDGANIFFELPFGEAATDIVLLSGR
jgi:hypothetical protein